jgi:hypothetical protein
MRMMRLAHTILFGVVASNTCIGNAGAQRAGLQGITFVVDTSSELTPQGPGVVKPLGLRVTFAANRGRIDVRERPARPALKVADVVVASSLAAPGDYYLFDSTGFILVRPASKQFSTFHISDAAFNYEGRRDGWPPFFAFAPTHTDTVADTSSLLMQHGEQRIYWHLDVVKDTSCRLGGCSVEELSRGRTTVADAPVAELIVVRWFGPAQSLAEIRGGIDRLLDKILRVTTVSPVTGVHRLRDLRQATVDPSMLTLPPDFVETPWPGFPETPQMRSTDRGAKWRVLPTTAPSHAR